MSAAPVGLAHTLQQFLPGLLRWAHGRLPWRARRGMETADLIQEAALGALTHLEGAAIRSPERTLAYLRRSVRNRIVDEIRRADRVPFECADEVELAGGSPSPFDDASGAEDHRRFRRCLARLSRAERHLLVGRMELHLSYAELAEATGRPSVDAARMATQRAMLRLREELAREAPESRR